MVLLKKKLGQHFLQDKNIIKKIVKIVKPSLIDNFFVIGPGDGAITLPLSNEIRHLTIIEKDTRLIPELINRLPKNNSIKIINADILKFNFSKKNKFDMRIIGNLPYNISTEIIFKLIRISNKIKDIHFMLQKEVVDRMVAKPKSKEYGRLSVMTQIYFNAKKLFDISPNVFYPKPKVKSSYIRLIPNSSPFKDKLHEKKFGEIVIAAFTGRRKMIKTSLKKFLNEEMLMELSIDPTKRPEMLSIKNFIEISKLI